MKRTFTVTVEMPSGVTIKEMKQYINDAVRNWAGGYDPELPIFDLDRSSIKVKHTPKKK